MRRWKILIKERNRIIDNPLFFLIGFGESRLRLVDQQIEDVEKRLFLEYQKNYDKQLDRILEKATRTIKKASNVLQFSKKTK